MSEQQHDVAYNEISVKEFREFLAWLREDGILIPSGRMGGCLELYSPEGKYWGYLNFAFPRVHWEDSQLIPSRNSAYKTKKRQAVIAHRRKLAEQMIESMKGLAPED